MATNCFLAAIYNSPKENLYEVAEFEDSEVLKYTLRYLNKDGLKKLYFENKYNFDFKIQVEGDDYFIFWAGPEVSISESLFNNFLNRAVVHRTVKKTIYDLLYELAVKGAYYLDYKLVDELDSQVTFPKEGISKFINLRVSKTTMRVYMVVLTEEGYRARSIVTSNNGNIECKQFHFMIDKTKVNSLEFTDFIEWVRDINLGGVNFSIFRVSSDITPYPVFEPHFRFIDPVINYKVYHSEQWKVAADILELYASEIEALLKEEKPTFPTKKVEDYDTDKSGVFFKLVGKRLNTSDKYEALKLCIDVHEKVVKDGWSFENARDFFIKRSDHPHRKFACLVLLMALLRKADNILGRLEIIKNTREEVLINLLRLDLELFAIRSFMCLVNYKLPHNADSCEIVGGVTKFYTQVKKVGLGVIS